jgi:hypothetical protein
VYGEALPDSPCADIDGIVVGAVYEDGTEDGTADREDPPSCSKPGSEFVVEFALDGSKTPAAGDDSCSRAVWMPSDGVAPS